MATTWLTYRSMDRSAGPANFSAGWMGGGTETVGGFNGARGLKNALSEWFGFVGLFHTLALPCCTHAFDARCISRFVYPAVPACTVFLQFEHSNLLSTVNFSAFSLS